MGLEYSQNNPLFGLPNPEDEAKAKEADTSVSNRVKDIVQFGPAATAYGAIQSLINLVPDGIYEANGKEVANALQSSVLDFNSGMEAKVADGYDPSVADIVWGATTSFTGTQDAAREYINNQKGYNIAGDIAVSFPLLGAATKLARTGGYISKGLAQLGDFGKRIDSVLLSTGMTRADRMAALAKEEKLFKASQGMSVKYSEYINQLGRQKWGMAADLAKESVAQEIALYSVMGDSETFFPKDMTFTQYLGWTLLPAAAISTIGYKAMGYYANNYINQLVAPELRNAINTKNLAMTDLVSMPEMRGVGLAASSAFLLDRKIAAKAVQGGIEGTNVTNLINAETTNANAYIIDMANDKIFGNGYDASFKWNTEASVPYINTVRDFTVADPSASIGLVSLQPATPQIAKTMKSGKTKIINDIEKEQRDLLDAAKLDKENPAKYLDKAVELQKQKEKVANSQPFLINPDGTAIPADQVKFGLLDDYASGDPARKVEFDINQDGGYISLGKKHAEMQGSFVAEYTGHVQITPIETPRDFTTVLKESEIPIAQAEDASRAFEDLTHLYDIDTGVYGKKVRSLLSGDVIQELDKWKLDSGGSKFRTWLTENPEKIDEIQRTFFENGLRERLQEMADSDGFLTLYRGEPKSHLAESPFNLVSMTPRPKIAAGFGLEEAGKQVIKRKVHIDDVVMPANGSKIFPGHEYEFIVKDTGPRVLEPKLAYNDRIRGWATMQGALDTLNPAKLQAPIRMAKGRKTFALDYAAAAAKKYPGTDVRFVTDTGELTGTEAVRAIEFESLRQKALSFQEWYAEYLMREAGTLPQGFKMRADKYLPEAELLRSHNLPLPDAFGDAPIVEFLKKLTPNPGDAPIDIGTIFKSMDDVENYLRQQVKPSYLDEPNLVPKAIRTSGSALKLEIPKDKKPVFGIWNAVPQQRETVDALNALVTQAKVTALDGLRNADKKGANVVAAAIKAAEADKVGRAWVSKVDYLVDGTQMGVGKMTTQNFAMRSVPMLQMADYLGEVTKKAANLEIDKLWEAATPAFTKVISSQHQQSANAIMMAVHELNQGWDVLREPVQQANGKWALALDPESGRNQQLANRLFGSSLEDLADAEGNVFLRMRNNPDAIVTLDDTALEGMQALTGLSQVYLTNLNAIREAYKLQPIPKREWHTPYYNAEQRYTLYMLKDGKMQYPVFGATPEQAMEQARKAMRDDPKLIVQSEDNTATYVQTLGHQYEAMADMSKAGVQTAGKSGRGGTGHAEIGTAALKDLITRMRGNFDDLTRYTAGATFRSEIDYAKKMKQALFAADNKKGQNAIAAKETIYDMYIRGLLQQASLTDKTVWGKINAGLEKGADSLIVQTSDAKRKLLPSPPHVSNDQYQAIVDLYGKGNSPYATLDEMIRQTIKVDKPITSRQVDATLNQVVGDLVLRIGETGLPAVNIVSALTMQPAIFKSMQRGVSDLSKQAWLERILAVGSPISDTTALPSVGTLMAEGTQYMFSKEGRAALQEYRDMGLLRHDVYERVMAITAPIDGYAKQYARKAVDIASWLTDNSEALARAMAFQMNHNVATKHLGLKGKAAIRFAHKHANANVGDYRPNNKPQAFQGVLGIPLGLFSTWIWNFGQRIFGDLEGGRLGAAGMQVFMQNTMFGADSNPITNKFLYDWTRNYDGTSNAATRMEELFGNEVLSWTKDGLLGKATGIDIGSRASVGAPGWLTGDSIWKSLPSTSIAQTMFEMVGAQIDAMKLDGPSWQKAMEILATYKINGTVSFAAEQIAGVSVDKRGNLINEKVDEIKTQIAHLMEMRTVEEKERLRIDLQNWQVQRLHKEHFETLRKSMESLMRGADNGNVSEEDFANRLDTLLGNYYDLTDNLGDAKRYLITTMTAATTPRAVRTSIKYLKKDMANGGMVKVITDYVEKGELYKWQATPANGK